MAPAGTRGSRNFIRPGKPVENPYIESFYGRFRHERLNHYWFDTPVHARRVIVHRRRNGTATAEAAWAGLPNRDLTHRW